jgi:hypothetical protein
MTLQIYRMEVLPSESTKPLISSPCRTGYGVHPARTGYHLRCRGKGRRLLTWTECEHMCILKGFRAVNLPIEGKCVEGEPPVRRGRVGSVVLPFSSIIERVNSSLLLVQVVINLPWEEAYSKRYV